jgi:hypothetical protein
MHCLVCTGEEIISEPPVYINLTTAEPRQRLRQTTRGSFKISKLGPENGRVRNAKVSLVRDTFSMARVRKVEGVTHGSLASDSEEHYSWRVGAITVPQINHAHLLNIAIVCCAL